MKLLKGGDEIGNTGGYTFIMQLFIVCFQDHLDHLCFLIGQDILKNVAVYTDVYGVCHCLILTIYFSYSLHR